MKNDDILNEILESYSDSEYPGEFSSEFDIMECLSEQNGICTFLVRDHKSVEYIAKCFDKSLWKNLTGNDILMNLSHKGLPGYFGTYENDSMTITVREYVEGDSLDRYATEHDLSQEEIVNICIQLCDILAYLHHREPPVIHRDIKPQNIIIRPDRSAVLIDFDIARLHKQENDTDTVFFGTRSYAPPEQYGFSQTDERTDIYSMGILLRWLLTGSTRENSNIKVYPPLAKIIKKCTGFSPKDRFSDVDQVRKALMRANPRSQRIRMSFLAICMAAAVGILVFGGIRIYRYVTYTPFTEGAIPAYMTDEERVQDAVSYLKNKYDTDIFDNDTDIAHVGDLRRAMIELYGLDRDYVYGINTDMPQENDAYFLPWGWEDEQNIDRDPVIYAAVKAHDASIVADWSSLKDDNGFYPGVRVAVAFAEKHGITEGANKPLDLTLGDMALILANTDRVFEK